MVSRSAVLACRLLRWANRGIGDVNTDGIYDVAVGSSGSDSVYVVFGSGTPGNINVVNLDGSNGFQFLGDFFAESAVSTAGDLNDDGFSDLLIGSPDVDQFGAIVAGQAYVIFGIDDSSDDFASVFGPG